MPVKGAFNPLYTMPEGLQMNAPVVTSLCLFIETSVRPLL